MDESEFYEGLKGRGGQDVQWAAAAEHLLRLKHQTAEPTPPDMEKDAYEIDPSDRPDIPKKDFAQPSKEEAGHKGKYPIPDRQHARSALGFAKMHHDSGALAAVRAKVEKKYPDMLSGGEKTAAPNLVRGYQNLQAPTRKALKVMGATVGAGAALGGTADAIRGRGPSKLESSRDPDGTRHYTMTPAKKEKNRAIAGLKGAARGAASTAPLALVLGGMAHNKVLRASTSPRTGKPYIDPTYSVSSRSVNKHASALDTLKSLRDPRVAVPAAVGGLMLGGLTYASSKPRESLGGKSKAEEGTASILKSQAGDDESKMGLTRKLLRRTNELSHGVAEAFRSHHLKATAMGAASGALSGATIARMMGAAKGT